MGLLQIDKQVLSGNSTTIAVNGIDDDSVYKVVCKNLVPDSTNATPLLRVNKSSSAQGDTNYNYAMRGLSSISFTVRNTPNSSNVVLIDNIDDFGGNAVLYLYNFNLATEYSFATVQGVADVSNQQAGYVGGFVHSVASASNGVTLMLNTGGNFTSGSMILYKVI
jgi:hypothetical protein